MAKLKKNPQVVVHNMHALNINLRVFGVDAHDACPVKRKSAGGDAPEGAPVEGASPEKKAKLDTADNGAATEENGAEAKVAA